MANPPRLILKYPDWPAQDRADWDRLFDEGDMFDEGPCVHWSTGGRRLRQQGYGRWLGYLASVNPDILAEAPVDRIRSDVVVAFIETELARIKPRSVITTVDCLFAFARTAHPEQDWNWLLRGLKRMWRQYGPFGLKPRQPISANTIRRWALRRMTDVLADQPLVPMKKAVYFRQALMIGLLIMRPLRARTFMCIQIDHHLIRTETGFRLDFFPEDMKDKRHHSYDVPDVLVDLINTYFLDMRPLLLGAATSDALWISQRGTPLTLSAFERDMPAITKRHLGVALGPHAFRHVAATSIANQNPEHVGITREVLGHSTMAMAEKHYNLAGSVESCNALQSIVLQDIKKARKLYLVARPSPASKEIGKRGT